MSTTTHIKFGANLAVTDEGSGVIRVDAAGGGGSGGPGAGATYVHTQGSPSASWVVVHNLGWWPSVTVVDTGDSVVIPDVHYDSANQATLVFGSATSGKAYLNPGAGVVSPDPGSFTYLFTQATPASTWTITHNLSRYPSVTVQDTSGVYVVSDVTYLSLSQLQVNLASPLAGRAYLV
jgi:hypothetical protein